MDMCWHRECFAMYSRPEGSMQRNLRKHIQLHKTKANEENTISNLKKMQHK